MRERYWCDKCKSEHFRDSKIGMDHWKYYSAEFSDRYTEPYAEPGPGAPALPVTKASPAGTGEPPALTIPMGPGGGRGLNPEMVSSTDEGPHLIVPAGDSGTGGGGTPKVESDASPGVIDPRATVLSQDGSSIGSEASTPLPHHQPGEPEPTPKGDRLGQNSDSQDVGHMSRIPSTPGSEEAPAPLSFEEAVIKYMEATSETIENFAFHIDAIDTAVRQLGGKVVAQGQNLGRVQIRQASPAPPPNPAEGIKELLELPLVQNLVTSVSRYLMGSTEGSAYERARATAIDRAASGAASKFDEAASAMFQAFVDGRVIVQGGEQDE